MKLLNSFASILAVAAGLTGTTVARAHVRDESHHAKLVDNYMKIWKGDLSLLNQTLSPTITFNVDRFPSKSGTGSANIIITTREEFGQFVISSRDGFSKYGFELHYWLGQGNHVAMRWYLDGVIGNFRRFPIALKSGDAITYNGTDSFVLNNCTGLVDQVDSTQDLITCFHNLGLTGVTV